MSNLEHILHVSKEYLKKTYPDSFKVYTLDFNGFIQTFYVMKREHDSTFDNLYLQLSHLGLRNLRDFPKKRIPEQVYETIIVKNKVPFKSEKRQWNVVIHSAPTFNFEIHDYENRPDVIRSRSQELLLIKFSQKNVEKYHRQVKPTIMKKNMFSGKETTLNDFVDGEQNKNNLSKKYTPMGKNEHHSRKLRIDVLHSANSNNRDLTIITELKRDTATGLSEINNRVMQLTALQSYIIYKYICIPEELKKYAISYSTPAPLNPVEGNALLSMHLKINNNEEVKNILEEKNIRLEPIFFWNLSSETGLEAIIKNKQKKIKHTVYAIKNTEEFFNKIKNPQKLIDNLQLYSEYLTFVQEKVLGL